MTTHERLAEWYYARGFSCEQAILAAFAGELGMSLVRAIQYAPVIRDRRLGCGAYRSGVAVLQYISFAQKSKGDKSESPSQRSIRPDVGAMLRVPPESTRPGNDAGTAPPPIREFSERFIARFGTTDCRKIMSQRRKGADCLDVIGETARLVEIVAKKYYGI